MKKLIKNDTVRGLLFLSVFVLFTVSLLFVDVRAVGPQGSTVGFGTLNATLHRFFGVNRTLYEITDWLGLVPIALCFCFALLGLCQWIRRKRLLSADRSLLVLGGYYLVVMAAYFFFETVVINYRPVLIDGYLESSYPSSTTLLVLCVIPTTVMQLSARIKNVALRRPLSASLSIFLVFMVLGRLLSGVHWATDILGSCLLSTALVSFYRAAVRKAEDRNAPPKTKS